MAGSLSLDERALILAPAQLRGETSKLLTTAGIGCLAVTDFSHLGQLLKEGAGLVVIAEQALPDDDPAPLHNFIGQQAAWSDLPVLLLAAPHSPAHAKPDERFASFGNLFLLPSPFLPEQLLSLARAALRGRRRQYQERDQALRLQQLMEEQDRRLRAEQQALHQTRKMEAIGQLAGGVAHDFNNLLTSIGGSLELMDKRLARGQTEGLGNLLRLGQDAVGRAARLTHRLLAFSSRQSLESQAVDLHTLLDVQRLSEALAPQIDLKVHMAPGLWQAEVDNQQLQEALDNLLHNACEAMPNGGELHIKASNQQIDDASFSGEGLVSGDYLRLSIRDNGQGMSQSTLERAFEPFFTTKPVGQGIGLGLSMVYGFSKQSRGHVSLRSQIGRGTQVDLYLPRYCGESSAQTVAMPPVNAPASRDVLIVEDDPQVRQVLCQALTEEGYECGLAGDASEALQILRSTRPVALLISDVGLPGMSGRQLAEIARKLRPQLQILFITGYAEAAMVRSGFLDPGMQLICKPFELKQLQRLVAQILGEPGSAKVKAPASPAPAIPTSRD
ncbi:ATP-binding protein [Pseudomonas sp. X10]